MPSPGEHGQAAGADQVHQEGAPGPLPGLQERTWHPGENGREDMGAACIITSIDYIVKIERQRAISLISSRDHIMDHIYNRPELGTTQRDIFSNLLSSYLALGFLQID